MDHQPGARVRRGGQFGHRMLEEAHLASRQGPQQQRRRQRLAPVQLRHEARQIGAGSGLVDQVHRRALAGKGGQPDRGLGRHGVTADQVLAHGVAGQGDQLFGDLQRQDLAIGHGRHDFGRLSEPGDRARHRGFRQVGVVVGRQGPHGLFAAAHAQGLGHVARNPRPRRHRDLAHGRSGADDLDQVLVGEGGRKADDGQGHGVHVGRQPARHIARYQVRGLQRHRHRPAHQFGGVVGEDAKDLLRRFPVGVAQLCAVDAATQLVRRRRPLVLVGRLDQTTDVQIGQSGAEGGHGREDSRNRKLDRS